MTQTQGDAWLANMDPTELQMAWFHAMPAWTDAAWAIGVWGGLLGAILLLLRRKWALQAFVASFLGWATGAVYTFGLSNGMEAMGRGGRCWSSRAASAPFSSGTSGWRAKRACCAKGLTGGWSFAYAGA